MPLTNEEARTLADADLLDVIVEEAAEVIQAATKAKRFGILDVNPNKMGAKPNAENIGLETKQLERLVRVLGERYGVVYDDLDEAVETMARAQLASGVGFSYRHSEPAALASWYTRYRVIVWRAGLVLFAIAAVLGVVVPHAILTVGAIAMLPLLLVIGVAAFYIELRARKVVR